MTDTLADKDSVLREFNSELSDVLFRLSQDDPEDLVAQFPAQLAGWGASDRIAALWQVVQFIDQCLAKALFQPDGVAVFDAFGRARSRAQLFLQKEIDALPSELVPDGIPATGPLVPRRLH